MRDKSFVSNSDQPYECGDVIHGKLRTYISTERCITRDGATCRTVQGVTTSQDTPRMEMNNHQTARVKPFVSFFAVCGLFTQASVSSTRLFYDLNIHVRYYCLCIK